MRVPVAVMGQRLWITIHDYPREGTDDYTIGGRPYEIVKHVYRDGVVWAWPTYWQRGDTAKAVHNANQLVSARTRWPRPNVERLNVATRLGIVFG